MKPPKPPKRKTLPGNAGKIDKALELPRSPKSGGAPRTSGGITNPQVQTPYREMGGANTPIKITGSATGTKSLTAAQVAKMNKMTSKYKMGNR